MTLRDQTHRNVIACGPVQDAASDVTALGAPVVAQDVQAVLPGVAQSGVPGARVACAVVADEQSHHAGTMVNSNRNHSRSSHRHKLIHRYFHSRSQSA
jgi:hypothetical protein